MISSRQRRHLLGIGLLSLSVFTLLSLLPVATLGGDALRVFAAGNVMGVLGALFSGAAIAAIGIGVLLIPVLLGVAGAAFFDWLEGERALRLGALFIGLAVLLPGLAALFAAETGYAFTEALPAESTGWVGRTLTLPFAALLGKFGAALALLMLLIALFVATIGWNPLGAAVRRIRAVRRHGPAHADADA
ncbi:MAG: DNA translocase FtsK 4TM domain-containing protein, partial [Longimicrobiales bacterium]